MSLKALQRIETEKQERNGRLDLSFCEIKEIPELLSELQGLNSLDLSCNQIQDLRPLQYLTQLKSLNLDYNLIRDLRPLTKLTQLGSLSLEDNDIQDLSPLKVLTQLQSLSLQHNKIQNIDALVELFQLETLRLENNQLKDLYPIKALINLLTLDLRENYIEDIQYLESLVQLNRLYLQDNLITDIGSLENLKELRILSLSGNLLHDLSPLQTLTQLIELNLENTGLLDLSTLIPLLKVTSLRVGTEVNDEDIRLFGNPIEKPPREIIWQGREAILEWFGANKTELNEVKLILIGDPKAGKTSLLRQLKDGTFNPEEPQTDGINIEDIQFGNCQTFDKTGPLKEITGHFWDFGGQEIMNSTHQFFLTNRSVYILVLNARSDNQVSNQVRKWVQRIRATGGDSPIIVVANQIDVNRGFAFENVSTLRRDFPQIRGFLKLSCKSGENLDQLVQLLEAWVPKAEMFNTEIDEKWLPIKGQLEEETRGKTRYLSEDRFYAICQEHKLKSQTSQTSLVRFLHDLGLLLHFKELQENLAEYYVLDPYWITYGVYQILTSNYAGSCKGIVSVDMLDYIINKEPEKKQAYQPKKLVKLHYSTNQRRFLLDILHEFKLCFYVNDHKYFIVPDLLEAEISESITEPIRQAEHAIRVVYQYTYLPKSIIPEIMVEGHHLLDQVWRTGCILKHEGSQALINADQDRVYITVVGEHKQKREFMSILRYIIGQINAKLTDRPKMKIPFPDLTQEFVSYNKLRNLEKEGETTYRHYSDELDQSFKYKINELLEGIPPIDKLDEIHQELRALRKETQSGFDRFVYTLDQHYEVLSGKLLPDIKTRLLAVLQEVKEDNVEAIQREVLEVLDAVWTQHKDISEDLQAIYRNVKSSQGNAQLKLKAGLPLLVQMVTGFGAEIEYDISGWAHKMRDKYDMKFFELLEEK